MTPVIISTRRIVEQLLAKATPSPDDDRIGHAYRWREADGRERMEPKQETER
jgi:hypothetical protein